LIQSIDIKENRFGFEPKIVAKFAQRRLRIFEMGISYYMEGPSGNTLYYKFVIDCHR